MLLKMSMVTIFSLFTSQLLAHLGVFLPSKCLIQINICHDQPSCLVLSPIIALLTKTHILSMSILNIYVTIY